MKEANKQAEIYVGKPVHDPAQLLLYAHRLYINYMIAMLLLVSCMTHITTFTFWVNPQNSQQKHTTKNFDKFANHSLHELWSGVVAIP